MENYLVYLKNENSKLKIAMINIQNAILSNDILINNYMDVVTYYNNKISNLNNNYNVLKSNYDNIINYINN